MIVTEFYRIREDGVELERTFSNIGMMIRFDENGALYEEAVEPIGTGHTYTETDIPIEEEGPA